MGGKRLKLLRVETTEDGSATKVVQMFQSFQILIIVHFDWYKYVYVTSTQSEGQDGGNYPESRRGKVVQ